MRFTKNRQQIIKRIGISAKDLLDLEKMKILHPDKKGNEKYFGEEDIRFLECWKKLRELGYTEELGFSAKVLKPHKECIKDLVSAETETMIKRTAGKIEINQMIKMVEEGTSILNTMIGIIHRRLILETVEAYSKEYINLGSRV